MSSFRSSATLVALAGVLSVAACSDSTTTAPATPVRSATIGTEVQGPIAYFPIRRVGMMVAQDSSKITWHGGKVLLNGMKVAAIYWDSTRIYTKGPQPGKKGAGWQDSSGVGFFLRHLGASPYYRINKSYTNGDTTHITPSITYTQF